MNVAGTGEDLAVVAPVTCFYVPHLFHGRITLTIRKKFLISNDSAGWVVVGKASVNARARIGKQSARIGQSPDAQALFSPARQHAERAAP
ncbi:hypothetical protein [Streptomyces sp. NBC_00076]|uniref:hypothetical protein n=1 Tax=Streptomyces sp. NBC_00076 TaxID=2975642 RepID=UPI0032442929